MRDSLPSSIEARPALLGAKVAITRVSVDAPHGEVPMVSGTSMASTHTRAALQRTRAVIPATDPSGKGRPTMRTHGPIVWMVAR